MNEESLIQTLSMYEKKLKEYMTDEEYRAFATQCAKTVFLAEILAMPDCDFKDCALNNWNEITGEIPPY